MLRSLRQRSLLSVSTRPTTRIPGEGHACAKERERSGFVTSTAAKKASESPKDWATLGPLRELFGSGNVAEKSPLGGEGAKGPPEGAALGGWRITASSLPRIAVVSAETR